MKTAATAVLMLALATAQEPSRFRSGIDAVRVDVLVTDGNVPVAGLSAADFELFDNRVRQHIDAATIEDLPVSMMLALDTSASVHGAALEDLKRALKASLEPLDAGDRVALMTFSAGLAVRADWTTDREAIRRAIDAIPARGGTALWDAIYAAITWRDPIPDRRALVLLFSDGKDTASWLPYSAVLDRARRSDAVVYSISVDLDDVHSGALLYRSGIDLHGRAGPPMDPILPELADISGGQSFRAAGTGRLTETFTRIVRQFRTRYLLTYSPTGVSPDGWHAIEVKLKNRRGAVRARRGYLR